MLIPDVYVKNVGKLSVPERKCSRDRRIYPEGFRWVQRLDVNEERLGTVQLSNET